MTPRKESMIERVVRVLEAFKETGGALTASEIARQTDIPVPSAHRIVTELVELGILERNSDRKVKVGMRLWGLVARSSEVRSLRDCALPYMEDLRAVVNAPTLLSILDRNDVVNIETLPARPPSATNVTQPGVRLPILAASPGLVLTAFSTPRARDHILESAKVTRFTEHTVVDRTELARIVQEARRLTYVVARRWITNDAVGVAVPVLSGDGTAMAALSVTIPFDTGVPSDLLPALHTTARGISRAALDPSRRVDPRIHLLMQRIRHATEVR
ncbi:MULTISPECIES: IclR family transcriptional regulator [Nocardia]|uniref:IclR family transcriptional regulator n=1 Tax=Nocardia violaceofusca TaxID=941182 RepID=UPI000AFD204C|nr:IclR family transcriptional regulator [Nocardia violaceofusca]